MGTASPTWPGLLTRLLRREDLSAEDTRWAMREVMTGEATPAQVAGFLVALRAKGESPEEVSGQPFLELDIGLPVEQVKDAVLRSLEGEEPDPVELKAVNRRGQRILCRVTFSPMRDAHGGLVGVILSMEDQPIGS